MDIGIFNVFIDSMDEEFIFVGDGVNVDFLSVVNELRDNDGVEGRNVGGGSEFVFKLFFVLDDVYGSVGKNVRRLNKDRVVDFVGKFFGSLKRGCFSLSWLVYINRVKDGRKFVLVFGVVDLFGVCIENVDISLF